jgi:hypothetical protein
MAAVCRRTVEARGDLADPARRCAAPQLRQREPGVAVLGGGVHPIDGDMGDPQIVVDRAVSRIDRIEFGGGVVGRARALVALARLVGRSGGDQRDAALGERLRQAWNGTSA